MKKLILFAVAPLVGFASCTKEAGDASGTIPDGGEYEIVFEELEGDGTKAAITEVYLDTKGDLAAKSQTLTARLQNKTTKAKISADSYTWSVNCGDAVIENVKEGIPEKNTLTARIPGTGKVSVSATYKGQSVTSSDVPVTVTESEIESIRLLGSDIGYFSGFNGISLTGSYIKGSGGLYTPALIEGSSSVSLLCLYDSGIESWNESFYSNSDELFMKIQPVLCLYVEVSYKGSGVKKKVNISDGVEYTFLDKEHHIEFIGLVDGIMTNYTPDKLTGYSGDYSHYDVYRMGFPVGVTVSEGYAGSGKTSGYYCKYFGDHQVKAVYKGFESTLDFNIAFNQEGFNSLNKLCDFEAFFTHTLGYDGHDKIVEKPNGTQIYCYGSGLIFDHNYHTWGITYRWSSPIFRYTVRRFDWVFSSVTDNYEFKVSQRNVKSYLCDERDEHWVYVETGQYESYANRFDVWFLNKCIYSVYCGPQTVAWAGHAFTGGWGDCPEYF